MTVIISSVPQTPDPDPTITIPAGHRTPVDDDGNPRSINIDTTTEDNVSEPDETFTSEVIVQTMQKLLKMQQQ